MLIDFVQFEFAGLTGLPEGRFLAREDEAERVLVVRILGAPRPTRRQRKRPQPVDPEQSETVPLTKITVAGTERFEDEKEALGWLEAVSSDPRGRAAQVTSATTLLNRAISALRAEARDPLIQELGATRALAVRIGYGTGQQLADAHWSEARQLPHRKAGRREDVDPQTRVAAVLTGRDEVHPAETFIQRARLDTQQGRLREAEIGLRAAGDALDEIPGPRNEQLREQIAEAERRLEE